MNFTEDFRSLFPLSVTSSADEHIASQIYEGLVKNDPATLQIVPSLAQKWEINDSSNQFTFHLRTNVFFHDNTCFDSGKGRKLIATDVKYCFQKLIHESPDNEYSFILKGIIKDNNSFKAINDSTFSIQTIHPCTYLISILAMPACWIYPREAYEKYGEDMRVQCVGTGPFFVKSIKEGDVVVLEKNPHYWRKDAEGNKLPYLDNIKFTFIKDKRSELTAFRNNELDMMMMGNMDVSMLTEILGDLDKPSNATFTLMNTQLLSFTYYGFLTTKPPFDNVKVRQAFNYAIDREKICDNVLQGEVIPVKNGFVPPGIPGYVNTDFSYVFDPDKAKQLIKDAGYKNGKGFPEITLEINAGGGERNVTVEEAVANMLKENLNINVKVDILPFAQHLDNIETGKSEFFRSGWVADMVDPRVFLELGYGGNVPDNVNDRSSINPMRFKNTEFDKVFDKATSEADYDLRMNDYKQAETIAMQNAFIMPLYYEDNTQLVNKNISGYKINAMDIRDLSEVYFEK